MGVLALQGDFAAHAAELRRRGAEAVPVRTAGELAGVGALVLPGGESSTMLRMMNGGCLGERLVATIAAGVPVLATCAGIILLARQVRAPQQESLGVLDVVVERNAYGRQVASAVVPLRVARPQLLGSAEIEGVFIRAPRVVEVGSTVEVLAWRGDDPVLLRQGSILAATFHPELSPRSPVIDLFVAAAGGAP